MTKSLDPPSKIIERVMASAKALAEVREKRRSCSDPTLEHKQIMRSEKELRKYLAQQAMPVLEIIMRVLRVGTGEVKAKDAVSLPNPTRSERLDHLVDMMTAEVHLAHYLEKGLAELTKHGIDVDTLLAA